MRRIAARTFAGTARRAVPTAALPALAVPRTQAVRWCSAKSGEQESAVNVEEFTLNDAVVKRHMEAAERWKSLSDRLMAAKQAGEHASVAEHVEEGLRLLEELGADMSPVQCETSLRLELAQAHYNGQQFAAAEEACLSGLEALERFEGAARDEAKIREVEELLGFVLIGKGDHAKALDRFEALLTWIDVDSTKAAPFVRVAAKNQRRSVLTGRGMARALMAASADDSAPLYHKALDDFVAALQQHVDEGDLASGKTTLEYATRCFEGLRDWAQAVESAEKYIKWCTRHEDEAGIAEGEKRLAALKELAEKSK